MNDKNRLVNFDYTSLYPSSIHIKSYRMLLVSMNRKKVIEY
jgi:hypothetical protein